MNTYAVIQARTSSTRFPGKVCQCLPYDLRTTVLDQVIRRAKKSRVDGVVVATTTEKVDDRIESIALENDVECFRGSEHDVLKRYYEAAMFVEADTVVRITADCPCIDPAIIDKVIEAHFRTGADYTSNTRKITYPRGMDSEVFSFAALKRAHEKTSMCYEREHVTVHFYENPESFKITSVVADPKHEHPDIRITLDEHPDYALLCCIYDDLYKKNKFFTIDDIIKLFDAKPWYKYMNVDVEQKSAKTYEDVVFGKDKPS